MIENSRLPSNTESQLSALASVATEGMRVIDGLRSNRYNIDPEAKKKMVEICWKCIEAHMEAFVDPNVKYAVGVPMSMLDAMKMLKSFADADQSSIVEYAKLHQDQLGDMVDIIEQWRLEKLSNEDLDSRIMDLQKHKAIVSRRTK